jgi:hypothetical protein
MKLSILGIFAAGAAAFLLQTGVSAQSSRALAAESCIVTDVMLHVKRCPAGLTYAAGSTAAEPTVTPTAAEPEPEPAVTPTASEPAGCIKTDVMLHVRRCPS